MTDLLTLAEEQIAEKQAKEIEEVKKRIDADKEMLKEAIALVNSHTLYKREEVSRGCYRYVLATEEMLKEDYLGEPLRKYAHKGISFYYDSWKEKYNKGIMEVNGHTYYDIRYALDNYEESIKDKESKVLDLNRSIRELKEELEKLHENYPSLKQAVMEWMAYQEENKAEK
jgi:peptidoglycan hydrolase CwlO-like protein